MQIQKLNLLRDGKISKYFKGRIVESRKNENLEIQRTTTDSTKFALN
jgi:hypothetical protein